MTMFKINAGKYRHIVTFQRLMDAKNPYGETPKEEDANWEDVLKVRVGIYPIGSREIVQAKMTNAEITHRVQMRFNPNFVPNSQMRIKFGTRIFDIIAPPINYQERNMEIEMLCKERAIDDPVIKYADPPTPINLALTRKGIGAYTLTWGLNGLPPRNFTRFDIVVNDVYTLNVFDAEARSYEITGLDETIHNYIYMATATIDNIYYSDAVNLYP